ncbi:MAG: sensor histidine kinase [Bacteroidetes bacterium]|nr:sensor histidine kinase [Bacteroidota bacterium]
MQSKGITIVNEWKTDFIYTPCNKSLVHTLLFNLVSNAIKYNTENGKIIIEGLPSDYGFEIRISDTGVGISEDQLPFIFDRFKRFRPEDEMSYGLGLPIVKTIADFHGIDVRVESTPGKGTTFFLRFFNNRFERIFFTDFRSMMLALLACIDR